MTTKAIMSAEEMKRTLARIAHEILEQNKTTEDLVLVGMHTRGVPLARRLALNIERFENGEIPVGALDATRYRDDLSLVGNKLKVKTTDIPVDIDSKTVILVDDVLYTGRTVRAAMDALIDLGRPKSIQLVVLIDRGHREMPIRADYVGRNIPSSRREEIQVHLNEVDGIDEVLIISSATDPTGETKQSQAQRT